MNKKYKYISAKIRKAREAANMSQRELANSIGYKSGTALSLIESANRKISIEELEKIANILHRDIKYFLGQKEDNTDICFALRANHALSKKDQEEILRFITFVKKYPRK